MASNNKMQWQSWCRLCASQDTDNATKISFETGRKLSLYQNFIPSRTIEKYFEIHIAPDDMYPTTICVECHTFTQSIIQFTERVAKVQEIYDALICDERFETRDNIAQALAKLELLKAKPDNLEYRVSPVVVKVEPAESVDVKEHSIFINDVEADCTDEAFDDNGHLDENEVDPFSKIDDIESSEPTITDKDKVYKRKRFKAKEIKCKRKKLPKNEEQNINQKVNCKNCGESFQLLRQYFNHMKIEHGIEETSKNWDCPKCDKVVSSVHRLKSHIQTHAIPCSECEKCFSNNNQLEAHVKFQHQNERAFVCEECGTCLRTRGNLKIHMDTHTNNAAHECEVCKKKFKNRHALKRHSETHSSRKYICSQCGFQLNSRTTLNRHLLVHSDEMQHKCDYCGRAFKRAKALKNHLILHTGLKPYACDFCDRTFANGSNCRTHKKKMHPEELAALEAAGNKQFTKNIPKLEILKAVTKSSDNLTPVVTKQSGCFAFGPKSTSSKSMKWNTKSSIDNLSAMDEDSKKNSNITENSTQLDTDHITKDECINN